ncbi:adenosylcobinamide amidohydrolase [Candidatus Bathyarchaeota archaeon]|nr:adenosylcobinamide amidohydrolase [Candidatus Bathyarchaeota archaeon]
MSEIPIKGVNFFIKEECLALEFEKRYQSLSSAVLNGGFRKVKAIVNYQVDKDFSNKNPKAFLRRKLINFPKPIVGLMTAADITKYALKYSIQKNFSVCTIVTAGISNAVSVGEDTTQPHLGTINIIVLVDAQLSRSGMVNLIGTITEAKSMALIDLDVRSKFSGELASGTTTDAVALACTGRGDAINYAGTGTNLGIITGKIVREAVKEAVQKQYLFYSNRPLINRLEERGITLEHMIDVIFKHHPELKCFSKEYVKKLIEDNLKKAEITLLTIAGLRLEEDYFKGLIPKIENINLELIDKIFGLRIAKIINNKHGVKEFLNLCKNDSKTLNLGMFSKSVIKGLLAGVSSKLKSCK